MQQIVVNVSALDTAGERVMISASEHFIAGEAHQAIASGTRFMSTHAAHTSAEFLAQILSEVRSILTS